MTRLSCTQVASQVSASGKPVQELMAQRRRSDVGGDTQASERPRNGFDDACKAEPKMPKCAFKKLKNLGHEAQTPSPADQVHRYSLTNIVQFAMSVIALLPHEKKTDVTRCSSKGARSSPEKVDT